MPRICVNIKELVNYAIARMRDGAFELDLVLRNNITTDEHPLGVYHPHAELHNIKKRSALPLCGSSPTQVFTSEMRRDAPRSCALSKQSTHQNKEGFV